jgi:spore coat polysaccharide biosynthesis protein SpsF
MYKESGLEVSIIIQARLSSKRLPKKVIMEVEGSKETLISCQIKRIAKLAKFGIKICIATSLDESDNELVQYLNCHFPDLMVFRGSLHNVLDRYYQCALENRADIVVRLTADCPFSDPDLIVDMIDHFISRDSDYLSNTMPPDKSTFSDGFDVEIFKFDVLKECNNLQLSDSDREHVTFEMWKSGKYRTDVYVNEHQVDKQIKLSIDYEEDFNLFHLLIDKIGTDFRYFEIDNFIMENKLYNLNDSNKINAGWQIK